MSSKSTRQQNPFLFPIPGLRSGGIKHEYITEIGKGLPEKNLKTNKFDLPGGWIAVRSSLREGRVFYYNRLTHRSSWIRPIQPDFLESEDISMAAVDSRQLVTWDSKVNEDAIYTPGTSSIRQIRQRSVAHEKKAISFQDALLKVGPSILLAKIMLNTMDTYFEYWLEYAEKEKARKRILMIWCATKIQARYRGRKLRKQLEQIRIEKILAMKCKDFPIVQQKLESMVKEMEDSEKEWFENLRRTLPTEDIPGGRWLKKRHTKYDERPKGWKIMHNDDVHLKDTVIESMVNHDLKVGDTKRL